METPKRPSSITRRAAGAVLLLLVASLLPHRAGAAADDPKPRDPASGAAALEAIEAKVRAWDFSGAAKALADLSFDDAALAERLATRRAEVAILAELKARMIAKVNNATPRLRKGTLVIPGLNADLTEADEEGITAQHAGGKAERILWRNLSARSARRLAQLVTDRAKGGDALALGLLAMVCGDPATAEKDLDEAKVLGVAIERHVVPLAEAALAKALALAERQQFAEAEQALRAIEAKLAGTPWLAAHKETIETALRRARGGASEAEAEKLYAQAAKLFQDKDLFELKPIIERLRGDFGQSKVVADAARKPSVAEMAQATAKLGKLITVRQDGKGDFATIQEAVDAAPPNSLVLVADGRYYGERLVIPKDKAGLTLKGKKGCWPIVGPEKGGKRVFRRLLDVEAPNVAIEGMVFTLPNPPTGETATLIQVKDQVLRLRCCLIYAGGTRASWSVGNHEGTTVFDNCIVAVSGIMSGVVRASNSLWLGRYLSVLLSYTTDIEKTVLPDDEKEKLRTRSRFTNCLLRSFDSRDSFLFQSCTVVGRVSLQGRPNFLLDSIIGQVSVSRGEAAIERCDLYMEQPYQGEAKPGTSCIHRDPLFRDLAGLDIRLRPTSPCRGKAADGGDLGCRLTPQMSEMIKLALDLRRRSVIDFAPLDQAQ